mgnify:FL=1|jgi:hypothetical protein
MNYTELVSRLRSYTEVDSNVLTADIIQSFIENAEWRILREIDSDYERQYATATLISGQRFINMPENTLVVQGAQIIDGTNRTYMEPRDPSFMSEYNPGGATGEPKYYSMWDETTLVFAPTADQAYTIQLNYILKPTSLSVNTPTTYISTSFPNGLLYACLVEAYGFLKGPQDLLQLYEQKYTKAAESFAIEQMGRRRRDEYQSGVPRIGKQ